MQSVAMLIPRIIIKKKDDSFFSDYTCHFYLKIKISPKRLYPVVSIKCEWDAYGWFVFVFLCSW